MEFNLKKELLNYTPYNKEEQEYVKRTIHFLDNNTNCYSRTNLAGHVNAGALVMAEDGSVLLNHHKILDKWLLFAGHSDGDTNSLNVAKREVMEESGITEYNDLGGKIFDVDVHLIPEDKEKNEPAHYHYDIRFLFIVKNKDFKISSESLEVKWMSIDEAKQVGYSSITRVLDKANKMYLNMQNKNRNK